MHDTNKHIAHALVGEIGNVGQILLWLRLMKFIACGVNKKFATEGSIRLSFVVTFCNSYRLCEVNE
jgi:hypothetical protein